jgi:hypothetical protein
MQSPRSCNSKTGNLGYGFWITQDDSNTGMRRTCKAHGEDSGNSHCGTFLVAASHAWSPAQIAKKIKNKNKRAAGKGVAVIGRRGYRQLRPFEKQRESVPNFVPTTEPY